MQLNGIWSSPTLFCYHLMLSSVDQIIRMDIWEKAAMNWPFAFYFLTGLLDLWLVVDVQLLDFFGTSDQHLGRVQARKRLGQNWLMMGNFQILLYVVGVGWLT